MKGTEESRGTTTPRQTAMMYDDGQRLPRVGDVVPHTVGRTHQMVRITAIKNKIRLHKCWMLVYEFDVVGEKKFVRRRKN